MTSRTIVHLVRHGEVHNPEKILYGRLPGYRLSELGMSMAERAGEFLSDRDIALVRSSPLLRARQTAEPIARHHGVEVADDERVIEAVNYFEGHRMGHGDAAFTRPRNWKYFLNPLRPSWGEPYAQQVARVSAAMRDARHEADGREAVLVMHQLPIWLTRRAAEGRPLVHDPRARQCALASVTSFVFRGEHLDHIEYSEPAAELLIHATDATGGKLT